MRKTILLFLVLVLAFACTAFAKVKTYDVYGPRSGWHDDKWEGYLLTWTTGGLDSTVISILSDSTTTDEDTTNAFEVCGLFNAGPKDTIGVLVYHCVSDTTIDSLRWVLDYSYDEITWMAGSTSGYIAACNNASGSDTTFTQYILGNPGVARGCQIFAPFWRARVAVVGQLANEGGEALQMKKLTALTLGFYAGGR